MTTARRWEVNVENPRRNARSYEKRIFRFYQLGIMHYIYNYYHVNVTKLL